MKEIILSLGEKFSLNTNLIIKTLDYLNLKEGIEVLDIGTGNGVMAIHLALNGQRVITGEPEGDHWADWETSAKKVAVINKINFIPFRAEELPFEDNQFQYIFAYGSFHHIPEKEKSINEFYRVLRKKGKLTIIEFNEKGIEFIRKKHPGHIDAVNPQNYVKESLFSQEKIIESELANSYIFYK